MLCAYAYIFCLGKSLLECDDEMRLSQAAHIESSKKLSLADARQIVVKEDFKSCSCFPILEPSVFCALPTPTAFSPTTRARFVNVSRAYIKQQFFTLMVLTPLHQSGHSTALPTLLTNFIIFVFRFPVS